MLLDINLPDGNGYDLCKLIKPEQPDTIVIFLTANDQESDQIRGYEVGAVDYITKPFVIGALQRKIKAMFAMLEHHKPAKDIYDDGRLFLDFSEQTASLNGKPLTLSPMEYKMLNLFRKNPRQVLTRGQLLEKLWDIDERFMDERTLDLCQTLDYMIAGNETPQRPEDSETQLAYVFLSNIENLSRVWLIPKGASKPSGGWRKKRGENCDTDCYM